VIDTDIGNRLVVLIDDRSFEVYGAGEEILFPCLGSKNGSQRKHQRYDLSHSASDISVWRD
jgi:hypothetical protein